MGTNKTQDMLVEMLLPAITSTGCEFWGLEYVGQGKHSVLRVYIDQESGISVDDCEQVSRQVSAVLDVEDPIKGEYNLEVSSPGMDRPLFTLDQFRLYIGCEMQLRLKSSVLGKRKLKATLQQVEPDSDKLHFIDSNDDTVLDLSFSQIDKANLIPVFE